jgi:hypothetical protein
MPQTPKQSVRPRKLGSRLKQSAKALLSGTPLEILSFTKEGDQFFGGLARASLQESFAQRPRDNQTIGVPLWTEPASRI